MSIQATIQTPIPAKIAVSYIAYARVRVDNDIERLAKVKDLVVKADRSGSAMGGAYPSTWDRVRFLLDEITALKNAVNSNQGEVIRLIVPGSASDASIAPKKQSGLEIVFLEYFLWVCCLPWLAKSRSSAQHIYQSQGKEATMKYFEE